MYGEYLWKRKTEFDTIFLSPAIVQSLHAESEKLQQVAAEIHEESFEKKCNKLLQKYRFRQASALSRGDITA